MATFIPYKHPRPVAPAPRGETLRPPAPDQLPSISHGLHLPHGGHGPVPLDLPAGMPGGRSWQPAGSHTLENHHGMEIVDLTGPDYKDPIPERRAPEDGQPGAEGDSAAANDGSRESTVDITGGAAVGGGDNYSDSYLPTLEELLVQTKGARRGRMAMSAADQKPTDPEQLRLVHNGSLNGGFPAGSVAGGDAHVGSSPRGSQAAPIVLADDDDGSDTEPDSSSSAADAPDEDDDQTLGATPTPPPDANGHDYHTSVPAVLAKPIANSQAQDSATDSASGSGQSLSDRSVKPRGVDRMDRSRPSAHRQYDRPSPSRSDEMAEGLEQDTPYTEAPAAAGRIHDIFAEYEGRFGAGSLTRKSGRPKGRSSPSSRRTNPVRHGSLALDDPCQQSVHDEHGVQDPDRTIASSPSEVGSVGSSAGPLTNMDRDGGGPSAEVEDQQRREPTGSPPIPPHPPSRKRPGRPAESGSHAPSPKRPCRSSGLAARRARGPKETSARSDSRKDEALRHALPRHCRDKEWDVDDLRISVGEDGSLNGELLWAPTTVSVSSLKGALLERAEEVVKRDHGAEIWDKWLEKQEKTGRRRRSRGRGGNSQGGK